MLIFVIFQNLLIEKSLYPLYSKDFGVFVQALFRFRISVRTHSRVSAGYCELGSCSAVGEHFYAAIISRYTFEQASVAARIELVVSVALNTNSRTADIFSAGMQK